MAALIFILVSSCVVLAYAVMALSTRVTHLEAHTLNKDDFMVDKLHRVFATNMEYVPKKRGRLLGSKNKKKRGRPKNKIV